MFSKIFSGSKKEDRLPVSALLALQSHIPDSNLLCAAPDGDRMRIGAAYETSPLSGGGGDFLSVVRNLFKDAPAGSVINSTLLCHPDHEAPEIFLNGKTHGGPLTKELLNRHARLLADATKIGWKHDIPPINRRRLFFTLSTPITGAMDEALTEEQTLLQNGFFNDLKSCHFNDVVRLSASELLGVYRQFLNPFKPREDVLLDDYIELKVQPFGPDEYINPAVHKNAFQLADDCYCVVVTCKSYPQRPGLGLMNLVSGGPFNSNNGGALEGAGPRILTPFIIHTSIQVADQRKEATRIKEAIDSRQTANGVKLPFSLGREDSDAKLDELQYLQRVGVENKFVDVTTDIMVFGTTIEEATESATRVKGILNKLQFDGRVVWANGLPRWSQSLPMNFSTSVANKLKSSAFMTTQEAAILLPVYGDFQGNVHRDELASWAPFLTRRGLLFLFNIFRSNKDYSGVIAASPGSGKSFMLQFLIFCLHAQGVEVILLDNGRSGEKLIKSLGGDFYKLSVDSEDIPNLNPFHNLTDKEFQDLFEIIVDLHMLLCFENENPENHPGSRIAMQESVRAAWNQQKNDADPRTTLECLENIVKNSTGAMEDRTDVQRAASNLVPRLKAFLDSPKRGRFFDGHGSLNPTSLLIGFELGGLSGDRHLQRVVNFFLANMLMSRPRKLKGGKRILFIDEAKEVMDDEVTAKAVVALVLKGRKDKTAVWPIFQSLAAAAKIPAGKIALDMSNWKIILGQSHEELKTIFNDQVIVQYANDPYFVKQIESLSTVKGEGGYSEAMIVGPEFYETVRLYVDPFTHTLFSTEDDARDVVLDLIDAGMPAVEAVCSVMRDHAISRKGYVKEFLETLSSHYGVPKSRLLAEIEEAINS